MSERDVALRVIARLNKTTTNSSGAEKPCIVVNGTLYNPADAERLQAQYPSYHAGPEANVIYWWCENCKRDRPVFRLQPSHITSIPIAVVWPVSGGYELIRWWGDEQAARAMLTNLPRRRPVPQSKRICIGLTTEERESFLKMQIAWLDDLYARWEDLKPKLEAMTQPESQRIYHALTSLHDVLEADDHEHATDALIELKNTIAGAQWPGYEWMRVTEYGRLVQEPLLDLMSELTPMRT